MKIIYLADQFYPERSTGTTKFIYNIANETQKKGNEVKIVTYSYYGDNYYDKNYDNVKYREFKYKELNVLGFRNQIEDPLSVCSLNDKSTYQFAKYILNKEKPNLIHVGHPRKCSEFINIANELNIPYIITFTDCFLFCPKLFYIDSTCNICKGAKEGEQCEKICKDLNIDYVSRFKKAKDILNSAAALYSPSEFQAQLYEREFQGIKVNAINHGMDLKSSKRNEKVYKKGDKLVFGFTSAITYLKGIYTLLEAFEELIGENVELKIYGDGQEDIINLIKRNDKVGLSGTFKQEEIGKIYNSIDVLICPSVWNENYPFVIREAFASQVPVIATNIGGMAESVKDGVNGFTFDRGDSNQLASIVRMLSKNPEILNYLKSNISGFYQQTIEKEFFQYYEKYNEILEKNIENKVSEKIDINNCLIKESNYNWKSAYDMCNKQIQLINDKEWEIYFQKLINVENIKFDYIYPFKIKLSYLKEKFNNKKVNYVIWGASNAGVITKKIIDIILPNFNMIGFIDKYKDGFIGSTKIFSIDEIENLNCCDYVFIATTPGKQESIEILKSLNKKLLEDYMYGYGL